MAMRTRKTYLIIEIHKGTILHTTTDRTASMQELEKLQKAKKEVIAQTVYQ